MANAVVHRHESAWLMIMTDPQYDPPDYRECPGPTMWSMGYAVSDSVSIWFFGGGGKGTQPPPSPDNLWMMCVEQDSIRSEKLESQLVSNPGLEGVFLGNAGGYFKILERDLKTVVQAVRLLVK